MDDLLKDFLTETGESLAQLDSELVRLEQNPDPALLQSIFRLFHTIKGTCGFLALPRLEAVAHAAETVLGRIRDGELAASETVIGVVLKALDALKSLLAALARDGSETPGDDRTLIGALERLAAGDAAAPIAVAEIASGAELALAPQSIRVSLTLLDRLMNLTGELVLARNQLVQLAHGGDAGTAAAALQRLSQITTELQGGMMRTRMQPVGSVWAKLPRLVRDLARDLGKKIDLVLEGGETELDRHVLEMIRDPLIHMVRNCADHGIEPPGERRKLGKPEAGRIALKAHHQGGRVVIELGDDGRGLPIDKIRAKAIADGLGSEAELAALPEQQLLDFVFRPGFSTAREITSVSGRGVGLDVVRANLEKIGATIEIRSEHGRGATFVATIPLTLAIVTALIVEAAGERFAVPQLAVQELLRTGPETGHPVEWLNAAPVLRLRGALLPLAPLGKLLKLGRGEAIEPRALVLVTQIGGERLGVAVDRVFGAEEIVVKPLGPLLRGIPAFAGNTILGDGSVIMILDPAGVAALAGLTGASQHRTELARPAPGPRDRRTSLLLFRAGPGAAKVVPLGAVARIEEVEPAALEFAAGRPVMKYRDKLMPLFSLNGNPAAGAPGRRPILVFGRGAAAVGLLIDEVLDIVDEAVTVERLADEPGLVGSAIVAGRAVEVVDAGFFLAAGQAGRPRAATAPRRVLLVEGDAFYRNLLTPLLTVAGYEVTNAVSAAAAAALCEAGEDFDAILGEAGSEELDRLRAGPWRDKPLIGLASDAGRAGIAKLDRAALLGGLEAALDRPRSAA